MVKKYKIKGLSCASCVAKIENKLNSLKDVEKASVNFATEVLTVEGAIPSDMIKEVVVILGYEISDDGDNTKDILLEDDKKEKKRMMLMFILTIPVFYLAMFEMFLPNLIPKFISLDINPSLFVLTQLALTIPVIYLGRKYYINGFKNFINRSPNMDSLIAIGTSAAFVYSFYNTSMFFITYDLKYTMQLYYEAGTVILSLITFGKYLEQKSKRKTNESIKKLIELQPKTANKVNKDNEIVIISIEDIKIGDILLVKPGEGVPIDGVVVEGKTSIDESMITGESIPIQKKIDSKVIGATINKSGIIKIKAQAVGADTTLSQIIKLIENAQSTKAPIARIADILSSYFVQVIILVSIVSGIAWYIIALNYPGIIPAIFNTNPLGFSLSIFISILVIACPCALGLATPTSIIVGTGKGAENGILIKNGEALETTHKMQKLIFDKTGTITLGEPKVTDIKTIEGIDEDELLQKAASLEIYSEHPLGEAIVLEAKQRKLDLLPVTKFDTITGKGIFGYIENTFIGVGNRKFVEQYFVGITLEKEFEELAEKGKTPMYVVFDSVLVGIIAVADPIKEGSKEAIQKIKNMGIDVIMVTGDNKKTAEAIGKEVGISNILSEALPKDKLTEIKRLQDLGYIVGMVGDGINDAPALTQADVGIAIGSGTEIAIESANIILMSGNLEKVVMALTLSKATINNIKQNLFWAFIYNIIGIPFAMGVLYGVYYLISNHLNKFLLLTPALAGAAMAFSSVSVVSNSLRLKRVKLN